AACSARADVTTGSANIDGPAASAPSSASSEPTSTPLTEPGTDGSTPTGSAPTGSTPSTAATPIPGPAGTKITWQRVDDHLDKGTLDVPIDYSDPSRGNFQLFLVRRRAN